MLEVICIPGRNEEDEGTWYIMSTATRRSFEVGKGRRGRVEAFTTLRAMKLEIKQRLMLAAVERPEVLASPEFARLANERI